MITTTVPSIILPEREGELIGTTTMKLRTTRDMIISLTLITDEKGWAYIKIIVQLTPALLCVCIYNAPLLVPGKKKRRPLAPGYDEAKPFVLTGEAGEDEEAIRLQTTGRGNNKRQTTLQW